MTFEPVDFEVRDLLKDLPDRLAGPEGRPPAACWPRRALGPDRLGEPTGGLDAPGVPIADGPAPARPPSAAGLKPGDVLTTLDGRWTTSIADAYAAAADAAPGRAADVVILRDGKEMTLTVRPADGI